MAKVAVKWDQAKFDAAVIEATRSGLDAAALVLVEKAQVNLSRLGDRSSISKTFAKDLATGEAMLRSVLSGVPLGTLSKLNQRRFNLAAEFARIGKVDPPGGFPRIRSGRLHGAITVEAPNDLTRVVGPDASVPYAAIHEFGGPMRGGQPYSVFSDKRGMPRIVWRKKGTSGPNIRHTKPYTMPARPYMRPALDTSAPAMQSAFSSEFRTAMLKRGFSL